MTDISGAHRRATEIKFVVDSSRASRIREWARAHMDPDPHGHGAWGDEYETTTLYFDTPEFDVFHRRGSFARAKYRVRRYGADEVVFLERKLRNRRSVIKRRTEVSRGDLPLLCATPTSGPQNWAGGWFRRRVAVRGLGAVLQLSYRRLARSVITDAGPARLTLDDGLRAVGIAEVRFTEAQGIPIVTDHSILELKFRSHLPAVFKRLIEELRLTPQVASKYRVGVSAVTGLGAMGDGADVARII